MIRLPSGREIRQPRHGRTVRIGNVQYCERDLFKPVLRAKLGIKDVVHRTFNSRHFRKTGETETDDGQTITITPTLVPKRSVNQLAKTLNAQIKAEGMAMYNAAKPRYDQLIDSESLVHDPADPYVTAFEQFRADLKAAYQMFRQEGIDIVMGRGTDAEKYQALIDFTWRDRWPTPPTE